MLLYLDRVTQPLSWAAPTATSAIVVTLIHERRIAASLLGLVRSSVRDIHHPVGKFLQFGATLPLGSSEPADRRRWCVGDTCVATARKTVYPPTMLAAFHDQLFG
jgi:hypothetical protein